MTELTRKQTRRVEVLKALAPLTRANANPLASMPVDGYQLRVLADWVLQEGDFAPLPDPVVISGETELGVIGLTDEARVEATVGGETQIGVVRTDEDGALWPVSNIPADVIERANEHLAETETQVDGIALLVEDERASEGSNFDRDFQERWDGMKPVEAPRRRHPWGR